MVYFVSYYLAACLNGFVILIIIDIYNKYNWYVIRRKLSNTQLHSHFADPQFLYRLFRGGLAQRHEPAEKRDQ
jgi:hypothetical protein